MERRARIFLACAFGAGIGSLVALKIAGLFWWVGMLIGGLGGYLVYDLAAIGRAMKIAWQATAHWRPSKEAKAIFWPCLLASLALATTMMLGISLLFYLLSFMDGPAKAAEFGQVAVPFLLAYFIPSVWVAVFFTVYYSELRYAKMDETALSRTINNFWGLAKYGNPFYAAYWLIRQILRGVWTIVRHIPAGTMVLGKCLLALFIWIGRFTKTVLVLIHSDLRLLCGCDAAIGAVVGYFAGNPLIGAAIGGIIGLLNYEIISVRLLHLAPTAIKK